ncbi:hypothetical protein Q8W71_30915 [Methylobacterium sp. NEAU 140]|uniref:hypothetical protein n=1 Tax=Methylobacterium sp. NEAU 140 TaxID=3064945 RepID=UPI002735CA49|nr:hypothetical protein [Methylobacterium sp. NEAU 140]MDP4027004.1 hypothetical protein [Methylobacterium sp. NEAU 140]
MTFTSGVPRPAAAGRKPGTPNRATKAAQAKADELGIDPFVVLLYFAGGRTEELGIKPYVDSKGRQRDPAVPLDLRMQAAAAAARFLLPQLKSTEITGANGGPLDVFLDMGEEALAKRRAELALALDEAV